MSTDGESTTSTKGVGIGPNGAKIKELEADDKQFYAVQRIMGVRHKDGLRDFLIKWIGYEELEWTPEENCGACDFAIKKFKQDMGWRGLKPWTQPGEWLLPTEKWNFEEGEQIPDEQLPGGSGQADVPVEPPTASSGSSQQAAQQNAGNKPTTSGGAASSGQKRPGEQFGASSGTAVTASHQAEKRPRLNQKASIFARVVTGPRPSPSPSTCSSSSANSTGLPTITDIVDFAVPTDGPSGSRDTPPSRASILSSPMPSDASVSPYPPSAESGAFGAHSLADVCRVPQVASEADSEVSLGSNNPLPTAPIPAGGFLQTPAAASSSSPPPITADAAEVCHMLEVDASTRKKALIEFVIDFRYKKLPEADRMKVKKLVAYQDGVPDVEIMKEDTTFEIFNYSEVIKNLAVCRGGFNAIEEWFPPLVEKLRPIFERGNGNAVETGEETVRHIDKYLKKLRAMSVPINFKLVSAVYNQVLRRVAPQAATDRATVDAMLRRTYSGRLAQPEHR